MNDAAADLIQASTIIFQMADCYPFAIVDAIHLVAAAGNHTAVFVLAMAIVPWAGHQVAA